MLGSLLLRFGQLRARKLAEAAADVNDLLLGASSSLATAAVTAAPEAAAGMRDGGGLERGGGDARGMLEGGVVGLVSGSSGMEAQVS